VHGAIGIEIDYGRFRVSLERTESNNGFVSSAIEITSITSSMDRVIRRRVDRIQYDWGENNVTVYRNAVT